MSSKLRTASWILLSIVGILTLLGSLASVAVAYFSEQDQIGPITLTELAGDRDDVAVALKARRGTAAAYGTGFALLFLALVLIPYRKGEVWSWWAILAGTVVSAGIILLRVPMLGTHLGLAAANFPLILVVLALLLDLSRLKGGSAGT